MQNYKQWLAQFSQMFAMYFLPRDASIGAFANEVAVRFEAKRKSLPYPENVWFALYMQLFILQTAAVQTEKKGNEFRWSKELSAVRERCVERVHEWLANLPTGPANRSSFLQMLQWIREQLFVHPAESAAWLLLYRTTLYRMRHDGELMRVELQLVEKMNAGLETETRHALDRIVATHHLYRAHDELCMQCLDHSFGGLTYVETSFVLSYLAKQAAWERLLFWLRALRRSSGTRLRGTQMREYLQFWSVLPSAMRTDSEYEEVLLFGAPWSRLLHAQFLLERERYEEWLELFVQSAYEENAPEWMVPDSVRSNHPELLLPIYHQTIERMLTRRAGSALEAVGWLQHLKVLYEAQGLSTVWRHYLATLMKQFKRSRVFLRTLKEAGLSE